MTQMTLIGDVHGKWTSYLELLEENPPERSIQLGDFGWGFPGREPFEKIVNEALDGIPGDHRYFRGNHDNPTACAAHEYCLDDTHWEPDTGLMVIAGGLSIDRAYRTAGFDWWEDEELNYDQLYETVSLFEERKPRIVLTHDGPEDVVPYMFNQYKQDFPSRTRQALGSMFSLHQPDLWVFGHWHTSHTYHMNGTKFICLAELETLEINL